MSAPINTFLLSNGLDLRSNPCVSPDFCLDWARCQGRLSAGAFQEYPASAIKLPQGTLTLVEDDQGDHAWKLAGNGAGLLDEGAEISGAWFFPASFANLLKLKNVLQEADAGCTVFPTAGGQLGQKTIGVGARFTTLHWPAVEWAMAHLGVGMTANQNSIPRELVYDVNAMLAGTLESVPFPFIGTNVPEGHQGQSVEGMSHGSIISKLKTGFHQRKIAWSFNADHQPIGGKFDVREDQLVAGCLLASYITFDLSPELAITKLPEGLEARQAYIAANVPAEIVKTVRDRVAAVGLKVDEAAFAELLCRVWPSMLKMKRRDEKYAAIRNQHFTTDVGRAYLRELSIDELPGLTTPETTAVMLAFCEAMDMPVNFVAPAFGFQKNTPYDDQAELRRLIEAQWAVCERFGVSIGFHSGSGKSAENYRLMGEITGSNLEIKTSGRYTYEMGVALSASENPEDKKLWADWYAFTVELSLLGAFAADPVEQKAARSFIVASLPKGTDEKALFASPEACRKVLEGLEPSADHMLFFEYNFLYVLAANGKAEKAALGDHTAAGYNQRARFYSISDEARLKYAQRVAEYLIFLTECTGIVTAEKAAKVSQELASYKTYNELVASIA
ncbi:MAG: tagaturonate epimerase family protein [Verrucomicrobiota bacterium JB022]|nr:tagaturonate epimerase family protein [Verrucomicrobiota bacterium JB022]